MLLGDLVYQPSEELRYGYFPTTAIVSLHYVTESGATAEMAGVGNEGLVGVSLFMGGNSTPSSAVVQCAGHAYRLERSVLIAEFARGGLMQRLLLRYTQALMTLMTQNAVCYRHHTIEQQLCRWLLLICDRVDGADLIVTQEQISGTLGVRRESVTTAAGKLQRDGFIRYRRGQIAVLDRTGLESGACECYAVARKEIHRLLSDVQVRQTLPPAAARSRPPMPIAPSQDSN
jgi:CRP-like cAMP-binding protein